MRAGEDAASMIGHTHTGLHRMLQHQLDDLFSLGPDDPRAEEIEKQIIQTRKKIRSLLRSQIDNAINDSKI